jgi:hypothetical protein
MNRILLLACCLLGFGVLSAPAQTPPRQVYVMPMAGGLDQYLADWLTREHVMKVVTDPAAAEVVLTDRLGEAFEQKLAELYPPPPPEGAKDAKTTETAGSGGGSHSSFRSTMARGTLFMVDVKSRAVLWSDHEKPRAASDANLNREAERVVKKLHETFVK